MSDQQYTRRLSIHRILIAFWAIDLLAIIALLWYPISIGILQLALVVAVASIWLLTFVILRRKRKIAIAVAAMGIAAALFLALPGRNVDLTSLRTEYVSRLQAYAGTPYVWGGESRRGIDCSGLIRRAMIDAQARIGLRTANPRALRTALDLWWHDCSALALRDEYRAVTVPLFSAESINSIGNASLLPGDIAVTANGKHVLAYLGEQTWIQADPGQGKVVALAAPHTNGWFHQPVRVMRWSYLRQTTSDQVSNAQPSPSDPGSGS